MILTITKATQKIAITALMMFPVETSTIKNAKHIATAIPWIALETNISSDGIKAHALAPYLKCLRPSGQGGVIQYAHVSCVFGLTALSMNFSTLSYIGFFKAVGSHFSTCMLNLSLTYFTVGY